MADDDGEQNDKKRKEEEDNRRNQAQENQSAADNQRNRRDAPQTSPPPPAITVVQTQQPIPLDRNSPQAQRVRMENMNELNPRAVIIVTNQRDRRRSSVLDQFLMPFSRANELGYETVPVGRDPTAIRCPNCNASVLTMVVREPKHPKCLLCFLLLTLPCCCCCWPCVCLPYCMDSCQNANHYCPNCNAYVGTFTN